MSDEFEKERHPIRFMFKFLVFLGILFAGARFLVSKKDEYYGITESEARAKMASKLGPRLGEEKASEIANQVIPVLKDRGVVKPDPGDEVVEAAKGVAEAVGEAVEEAKA